MPGPVNNTSSNININEKQLHFEEICNFKETKIIWLRAIDKIGRCFQVAVSVEVGVVNFCEFFSLATINLGRFKTLGTSLKVKKKK